MFIYVLWFTFKIIVRYFVCITKAKAFRVRRHFPPHKHQLVLPILESSSFSLLLLLLISSPELVELNSLHAISGSRSYSLSLSLENYRYHFRSMKNPHLKTLFVNFKTLQAIVLLI